MLAATIPTQNGLPMFRAFAGPSSDTFDVPPIGGFVRKYLLRSKISIDPFARNKRWATYTNDLNPDTAAESHLDAEEFLRQLAANGVKADLLIFDPPYSPRQIAECYAGIGRTVTMQDTQSCVLYSRVRSAIPAVLSENGIVLSFGWNSNGMGRKHGFAMIEMLVVAHGAAHNDTICIAEQRVAPLPEFDFSEAPSVGRGTEKHLVAQVPENADSAAAVFQQREREQGE